MRFRRKPAPAPQPMWLPEPIAAEPTRRIAPDPYAATRITAEDVQALRDADARWRD